MARINFVGKLVDEPEIRVGFIGCGSHSFRNIYPTFQFAPVKLAATCDLDIAKAQAFAAKFGAESAYDDYHKMLASEKLDAVFIVTGYDKQGRPMYPKIAADCLAAGCHVWIEKPPAATVAELENLKAIAARTGKTMMVGLKKMFFPANEKARELMGQTDFGPVSMAMIQYPQYVPPVDELRRYLAGETQWPVVGFLDHLCHPASLMVYLLGMPKTLHYERSGVGGGLATFTFAGGAIASLSLTHNASGSGAMERTTVVGGGGCHVVVDNNIRVTYYRNLPNEPGQGYGSTPSFYRGRPDQACATWEPEFSLGQLYNKGIFLLGYWGEVNEFARAVLENRPPAKGTLDQAIQVTRIFEAFAQGPGKQITL